MAAAKKTEKPQKKATSDKAGGKKKEQKKWVKTATKEKVLKNVIVNKETFEKMKKEICAMGISTPSSVASKYNLNNSLSIQILKEIERTGEIELITKSAFGAVYAKKVVQKQEVKPAAEQESTAAPEVAAA